MFFTGNPKKSSKKFQQSSLRFIFNMNLCTNVIHIRRQISLEDLGDNETEMYAWQQCIKWYDGFKIFKQS